MYPLAHMYMLNKLVNKSLGRHLIEKDAVQAMGVWLLDAVVTQPLRAKDSSLQGMFHSLDFDVDDPLQTGMKIHVYCDNLANFGTLDHKPEKRGGGFLSKREEKLYIPGENSYAISDDFRRRVLQCGIDMLVVHAEKEELKKYFGFSTDWAKKKESRERIYDTFVYLLEKQLEDKSKDYKDSLYKTLKDACEDGLMNALIKYSDGIDYMMTDWRRAKVARDRAKAFKAKDGKEPEHNYCDVVSIIDLIQSNFSALDCWQKDVDAAVGLIIKDSLENPEKSILHSFSR